MEIIRPESNQPIPPEAKKVFSGVIFDVYQWEQELYDGKRVKFEKIKRTDTVIVFPVLEDGRILLIEEEQPGQKPGIGAPGGRIESGEEVLEAVKREMLEETGYTSENFILWDALQVTSKVDWAMYTFVAKGLKKISDVNLDGGEKIGLKPVTFDEFIKIAIREDFREQQIVKKVLLALSDSAKMEELKKLFSL